MLRDFQTRRGGGYRRAKGIRDIYPTETAGSRDYPGVACPDRVPIEVAEPRAISCRQCGWPIPDTAEITTCPFCASDNFEGKEISR